MAGRTPYPQEMKERAVRMVGEIRGNYGNEYAAIKATAARLGIGSPETVRKWLRRAQVDAGEFADSARLGDPRHLEHGGVGADMRVEPRCRRRDEVDRDRSVWILPAGRVDGGRLTAA